MLFEYLKFLGLAALEKVVVFLLRLLHALRAVALVGEQVDRNHLATELALLTLNDVIGVAVGAPVREVVDVPLLVLVGLVENASAIFTLVHRRPP